MKIRVHFEAQVRRAAGIASTAVTIDENASLDELLRTLAETASEPVRNMLIDDAGDRRSTLLLFVNDDHVPLGSPRRLTDDDTVTITSPISGG